MAALTGFSPRRNYLLVLADVELLKSCVIQLTGVVLPQQKVTVNRASVLIEEENRGEVVINVEVAETPLVKDP